MADNYETTSVTLHFDGEQLKLGPVGEAIIDCLFNGEGWFQQEKGIGAYQYDSSGDEIFEHIADAFGLPEDLEVTYLYEVLAALKQSHPELVSDRMMERAETFWSDGVDEAIAADMVLTVLLEEPGTNLTSYELEKGWSCSKLRHGEFGGCGYFEGRHVVVTTRSYGAGSVGKSLEAAVSKGDVTAAAKTLLGELLRDQVKFESPEMRTQVMTRLGELLLQPEAETPPAADA